jgi:acyl-coenzyme A synthetase/AMP-(fatty) acid ligase/acyl carrier protein
LLTNDEFQPLAEELSAEIQGGRSADEARVGLKIINVEHPDDDIRIDEKVQDIPISSDAIACLTYTSGSTGRPKGVIDTHINLLHYAWMVSVNSHYGPGDRHGIPSSLGTGGAIMRIFSILLCGASLCIYNLAEDGVANLPDWLRRHQITTFNSQPTLFRYICNALLELTGLEGNVFPPLRLVMMGGEPVSASDIELFKRCFPSGVALRIGGGSNEAVWIAECYLDHESQIGDYDGLWGYPALDREILIWDEDGSPLPEGETGEIVVKSRFVAPGYWRKDGLTREVFLPVPDGGEARLCRTGDLGCFLPGGLLVHKGRMDFMVKVLGYAVQPGEVEATLLSHPEIKHAAVVGRADSAGENQLVAFAVSSSAKPPSASDLRTWLGKRLPDYMIPARIHFLGEMPRTATGKVDRLALPEDLPSRPGLDNPYIPPRTALEKKLVEIWSQVLDVDPVGVLDNFLDLGGNSLRAMQVINQVSRILPVELSVSDLLSTYTIEDLAELIETRFDIETS